MIQGLILLLLAEFSFALATVFAKIVTSSSDIQAMELTFFRFIAGFLAVAAYSLFQGKDLRPKNFMFISLRAIFNTAAVIFFFLGIQFTTVTKANMLNMTYPLFIFLIAPFMTGERSSRIHILYLAIAILGMFLVIVPDMRSFTAESISLGDLYSLLSGVFAAVAVTSLRQARKSDESHVILFYLMLFGTIITLIFVIPVFVVPRGAMIIHVSLATAASVAGQIFITIGYKYIDAAAGSLVSSSRILFGLILGVSIFSDPLTLKIAAGATLILISLAGVSGFWKRKTPVKDALVDAGNDENGEIP